MGSDPFSAALSGPTTKEIQQDIALVALRASLSASQADLAALKSLISSKNVQITRLEAENVRLKMTRTDKELATQVDGLRHEVGRKDRALVDYRRQLNTFLENEKVILHRAAVAEQKVLTVQNTLTTMQRARDAAQLEVEKHERDRLDAVRTMIAAQDRAKTAEARIAELEKKGKPPIAPNQNALKSKK
jgi:chromosome segregation ATPase